MTVAKTSESSRCSELKGKASSMVGSRGVEDGPEVEEFCEVEDRVFGGMM